MFSCNTTTRNLRQRPLRANMSAKSLQVDLLRKLVDDINRGDWNQADVTTELISVCAPDLGTVLRDVLLTFWGTP